MEEGRPLLCCCALTGGDDIRQVWRRCPTGVDVLISHGPARGHGDRVWRGGDGVGCEALREVRSLSLAL